MQTPHGRGAVAVVTISGSAAMDIARRYLHAPTASSELPIDRIVYGRWGADVSEDVVVCRRNCAHVEVQCHGGAAAVERIVADCKAAGAVEQPWAISLIATEHLPIRAAATVALSKASTLRAASILLDQFHGALDRAVQSALQAVQSKQLDQAIATIDDLLACAPLGLHLTEPWHVVVAGPPNVGKSSLINALLGYERAIVFDQPGTTRDAVSSSTALDGWPVRLTDTAGLRATDDAIEQAGIDRATQLAGSADCLVLLFDCTQPWSPENDRLIAEWPTALVVHNKADLSPAKAPGMAISAVRGSGLDGLLRALVDRLVPAAPPPAAAAPFTPIQVDTLKRARDRLHQADAQSAQGELKAMLASRDAADRRRDDLL